MRLSPILLAAAIPLAAQDNNGLPLDELIQDVVSANAKLIEQKLNVEIGELAEEGEKFYFEPEFFADITYRDTNTPNNAQQTLTRAGLDNYFEEKTDVSFGLTGNLLYGTNWRLEYLQTETSNSVIDTLREFPQEYETQIKATLKQPLLKGFGKDIMLADYKIAKLDNEIIRGVYKEQLIDVVAYTIREYSKLYGAQILVQSLEEAVARLQQSVDLVDQRFQGGDIAESDVFEIKSRLLERKVELNSIRSSLAGIQNQIRRLANNPEFGADAGGIVAIDSQDPGEGGPANLEAYFTYAKENRAVFEASRLRIEQGLIRLKKEANGAKPELNLVGSTWHSDLNDNWIRPKSSMSDDFASWLVGVEYRMPMFGDKKGKGKEKQARRRLIQAQNALQDLERETLINLRERLKDRDTAVTQLADMQETYQLKKQLMDDDFTRFDAGDIPIDELIENEDDATTYYRKVVNKLIESRISQANLDMASGFVLEKYSVDTALPTMAEKQASWLEGLEQPETTTLPRKGNEILRNQKPAQPKMEEKLEIEKEETKGLSKWTSALRRRGNSVIQKLSKEGQSEPVEVVEPIEQTVEEVTELPGQPVQPAVTPEPPAQAVEKVEEVKGEASGKKKGSIFRFLKFGKNKKDAEGSED